MRFLPQKCGKQEMNMSAGVAVIAMAAVLLVACSNSASLRVQQMNGHDLTLAYLHGGAGSRGAADRAADSYCQPKFSTRAEAVSSQRTDMAGSPWDWTTVTYRCSE